jgi:hypothetical protein
LRAGASRLSPGFAVLYPRFSRLLEELRIVTIAAFAMRAGLPIRTDLQGA